MKIEKEYDVQELANKVKQEIEKCGKCGAIRVGIDFITAQYIVDVLEAVVILESKRTESEDTSEEVLKEVLKRDYLENRSRQEILYDAET